MTARSVALAAVLFLGAPAAPASAQFSDPCDVPCALVLGASAYTVAIGTVVAYGRATGGYSTRNTALGIWGTSFIAVAGSGMALSGNGERQERAVYSSGIGAIAGALTGLGVGSTLNRDRSERLAAVLMGAAVGALVGGFYGALSYDEGSGGSPEPAQFGIRIPF